MLFRSIRTYFTNRYSRLGLLASALLACTLLVCALPGALLLPLGMAQVHKGGQKQQAAQPVSHPAGPAVTPHDRGQMQPSRWWEFFRQLWREPSVGITQYREGRYHQAFASLQTGYFDTFAGESGSKSRLKEEAEALFNLAAAAFRLRDFGKAEGLLLKLLRTHYSAGREDFPMGVAALSHYNLGNTLVELGKLDGAIAAYQQAITLKEGFAEAAANLLYTQKLKEYLDSKKPPNKQKSKDQGDDKNKQQKDQGAKDKSNKDQKGKDQKSNKDQGSKKDKNQDQQQGQDKHNQDQQKESNQGQKDEPKEQEADSAGKDKNENKNESDDEAKKNGAQKQGTSTWQNQKSLKQRNAERLLESIQEDRRNYLKRRLPKNSANGAGGKRW